MKLTFGKFNYDGSKPCYLKYNNERIFVCWFNPSHDQRADETQVEAVNRMIISAGYKNLEDFWETKSNVSLSL